MRFASIHAASILATAIIAAGASPALADNHAQAPAIEEVLAHERRADDRARDQYRNPARTLDFFQLQPGMTVAEWGPGGGWYTRILAPYNMPTGRYIALNADSDAGTYNSRAQEVRAKGWTENFRERLATMMQVEADSVLAFEIDEVPEALAGSVDRALIFRSMHGLNARNMADDVIKALYGLLKDDGMIGVVQHRAPDGASYAQYGLEQQGYMRQQDVVAIFEANGFRLVAESEINANPADPANWEGGVWTLPPSLGFGSQSPEEEARHRAIGESDRMTLLFAKS